MYPSYVTCNQCQERFDFSFKGASYYLGKALFPETVADAELLDIPRQAVWCRGCDRASWAENIKSVREFEQALAAYRLEKKIECPFYCLDKEIFSEYSQKWELERFFALMAWRYERTTLGKTLCCGSPYFHALEDEERPLRHAPCEYGTLKCWYWIGSGGRPPTGPLNLRFYSSEGWLMGMLKDWNEERQGWNVEAMNYHCPIEGF